MQRIVRGLHYHVTGMALPLSHRVPVVWHLDSHPELVPKIQPYFLLPKRQQMIEGIFRYMLANTADDSATLWLLTFYERVHYVVATVDPEDKQVTRLLKLNRGAVSPIGIAISGIKRAYARLAAFLSYLRGAGRALTRRLRLPNDKA